MSFRNSLAQFIRVLMVILVAVSFAMFFDVFITGSQTGGQEKRLIRSSVYENQKNSEIVALKNRHEKYMKDGVGAIFDYAEQAFARKEKPPLSLPVIQEDVIEERSLPESDAGEEILITRPSMTEPVLSKKNEARLANFAMTVDGFEKSRQMPDENGLAGIEPASGGNVLSEGIPEEVPPAEEIVSSVVPAELSVSEIFAPQNLKDGKVRVVVIIDDMGVSPAGSAKIENLPAPLTLSYLPYAENLPERTKRAKERGHELMVHMPMQPMNGAIDGGPAVLKIGMDDAKFREVLLWGLSRFDGYVGVNNHMGSRLTKDREAMKKVMAELAGRSVYFIDSKTIGSSVAADEAARAGMLFADRDVFLDHEISDAYVASALRQLEATARRKGYAIAIGHPHPQTIKALEKWIPTLAAKGIELVPASAVVRRDERYIKVVQAEEQSGDVSSQ